MPTDTARLAECEFWLISEMNSFLIVHHPYRTLTELYNNAMIYKNSGDEHSKALEISADEHSTAWQIINDSCVTDLPLIYPPHVIALTAIFLAVVLKPSLSQASMHAVGSSLASSGLSKLGGHSNAQSLQSRTAKVVDWYTASKVDMEAIIDCTQEIISLYEVWESFATNGEKSCREKLCRLVKQRGLV